MRRSGFLSAWDGARAGRFLSVSLLGACAFALTVGALEAPAASAAITYAVNDHPDGGLNCRSAPVGSKECYMLRLQNGDTFSADAAGAGVQFSFSPGATSATISGTVQHYQGGGFYDISADLMAIVLTDGGATNWHAPNPSNLTYDDMISDLQDNSDATASNDATFRNDLDRIYFEFVSLELQHAGGPNSYTGPLVWDEFPNDGSKLFFLQVNHRINTGAVAAAGWLEPSTTARRVTPSDFLFVLSDEPLPPPPPPVNIPEPATGGLMLLGVGALAFAAYRRRRA